MLACAEKHTFYPYPLFEIKILGSHLAVVWYSWLPKHISKASISNKPSYAENKFMYNYC